MSLSGKISLSTPALEYDLKNVDIFWDHIIQSIILGINIQRIVGLGELFLCITFVVNIILANSLTEN